MNPHDLTLTVYGTIAGAGAVIGARARRPTSSIPTLGAVVERLMKTRSGRVGLVAGWAWLGMHFFAR